MNLKKLITHIFFALAKLPMTGQMRCKFVKLGGVDCSDNCSFIGDGVFFDTIHPEFIHLGKHVHITSGVRIMTHYLNTEMIGINWRYGHVFVGDDTFIGSGTIICKDVKIGKNCIIGAGSVITKNIPDNQIWAGNPAHFIKERT